MIEPNQNESIETTHIEGKSPFSQTLNKVKEIYPYQILNKYNKAHTLI